jgi:pyrroloquinoline quinone biosynthesis protein B
MKLFDSMPAKEKEKIMFIHFNHTNPLLNEQSEEARLLKSKGFRIAEMNLRITL